MEASLYLKSLAWAPQRGTVKNRSRKPASAVFSSLSYSSPETILFPTNCRFHNLRCEIQHVRSHSKKPNATKHTCRRPDQEPAPICRKRPARCESTISPDTFQHNQRKHDSYLVGFRHVCWNITVFNLPNGMHSRQNSTMPITYRRKQGKSRGWTMKKWKKTGCPRHRRANAITSPTFPTVYSKIRRQGEANTLVYANSHRESLNTQWRFCFPHQRHLDQQCIFSLNWP